VTKSFKTLAFVCVVALASTTAGQAQEKAPAPPAAARTGTPINATPLKVQVVIGRYQGEKKISSLPYTLTMNANNHASLRMGTSMPVIISPPDSATPKGVAPPASIQYRDIGTNIDCASTALDEGRYLLSMTVDDSSVYPDEPPSGATRNGPSFRSFRAINAMILKNGETGQFTTATDKMTGETVKIDVTLTVMK
jgi:hypothetical protein